MVKHLTTMRETQVRSLGLGRSSGEGNGTPLVLLPGKSHGWRSMVGYSAWGHKELEMTEQLQFTIVTGTY